MPDVEQGMKVDPTQVASREEIREAMQARKREQDRPVAAAPRFDTPIFDLVRDAGKMAEELRTTAPRSPEDTPDIIRTAQMLDGVIQGLERRAADLVAHVAPLLTDPDAPWSAGQESAMKAADGGAKLMPESALGQRLWSLYLRLSAVESVLDVTDQRLAV